MLKAQTSFSGHILFSLCPSVRMSVHPTVCKLLTFFATCPERRDNFNQYCHKVSLGKGNLKLFKLRVTPFSKERYR